MVALRVFLFVLFFMIFCSASSGNPICHDTNNGFYVDESCQLWYCSGGKPLTRMPPCADNMVFSKDYKVCVPRNSVYDDCSGGLLFAKFEDPCIHNPCTNGQCLASADGQNYICSCYPGYEGIHCENDIDECMSTPCKNGGLCVDAVNDYKCQCPTLPGGTTYTGKTCETAVAGIGTDQDATGCGLAPCKNGGLCISLGGDGYLCSCPADISGVNCETVLPAADVCDDQPCINGGTCSSSGGSTYTCTCAADYTGNNCEIGLNPCRINPCINGGHCVRSGDQYTCKCPVLFTGNNCHIDLNDIMKYECDKGATLLPHPDYCQLYFDCSQGSSALPNINSQYLNECMYPKLFNNNTKRCDEAFAIVDCGSRIELKSGCDYLRNSRLSAHGRPCDLEFPSCESRSNGIQVNPEKLYGPNLSPYYIVCFKERLIGSGMCGTDGLNERMMFYTAAELSSGECTSLYKIPKQNGGKMPECSDPVFEIGVLEPTVCDRYYICFSGSTAVMKCPEGTVYADESINKVSPCFPKSEVCPPCGTKTEGC